MRFFKVLQNISVSNWSQDVIQEGEIICFSRYFTGIVVISDGTKSTRHFYSDSRQKLNLILSGKVIPLTETELNRIRPHLKKEHLNYDL